MGRAWQKSGTICALVRAAILLESLAWKVAPHGKRLSHESTPHVSTVRLCFGGDARAHAQKRLVAVPTVHDMGIFAPSAFC